MPKIEFRENKVLKLINIISRKVPIEELKKQDRQINLIQGWIKAKGYQSIRPLIMYSTGITGMDGDKPIMDNRIMFQLQNNSVKLEIPYKFENELRRENCLMARFSGKSENLQFATQKLTLYAYENDLNLTGETYMIILEQLEDEITVDVFMPLKEENESL